MDAERFLTMSLGSQGPATIPNRTVRLRASETNKTSDIAGAASELRYLRFTHKPDGYETSDITGSKPMALHRASNKVDYSLVVDDIDYARPRPLIFKTSRETNPLNPEYKLPTAVMAPPPEFKFVRDAHCVADIEGTASKSRFRFAQRATLGADDIEGAQAGWRPRNERARREAAPRDALDVHDINNVGFKTTRVTDAMQPVYHMNGMEIFDDAVRSKPKRLPQQRDGPYNPLYTDDIEGARSGWKPPHALQPPLEQRRQFRHTNFIGDISGAQPDTVRHSIVTMRETNPLNPEYRGLDGEHLGDPTHPDFAHLLFRDRATDGRPPQSARPMSHRAPSPAPDRYVLRSSDGRPRVSSRGDSPGARLLSNAPPSRGDSPGGRLGSHAPPSRGEHRAPTGEYRVPTGASGGRRTPGEARERQQTAADVAAVRDLY
ncbi:hypothetical protein M885DRAFT_470275 [Pelagophyceae sp. CCMP2097]|nr:hypothetical protein M885DRAFT_470275 [Pelagophyceae sp. CCMP2097]|mmetsp:Transcript_5545/g.19679  ORF Transcript_5545/g.19679 Transcript_5545/m.19679 type:complete len:433 (-) Transcript_5545:176-1474(-)